MRSEKPYFCYIIPAPPTTTSFLEKTRQGSKIAIMKVLLLAVLVAISVGLTTQCPPDVPIFNCLIDPCTTATCPNHPTATCRADYCGGCNARWYLAGSEVTNNCSVSLPSCPSSLDDGQVSICVQACTSNSTCSPGQYCCQKSTCGTACVTPDPCAMIACDIPVCTGGVPPISDNSSCCPYCPPPCSNVTCPIPLCLNGATPTIPEGQCCPQCPSANNGTENASCPMPPAGIIGTCILACTGDDSCPGSQLCCSNGCGRVCTDPVTTTCTGHDGRVYQPGQTFMAADGCNNCTCTSTGLALCTLIACPQGCVDSSGNRHAVGQNFTAPDGCNHCVCTAGGTIACTEIYCPPQNCPARLPAGCVGEDSDCPRCDDGEICCSGCCVASVVTCLDSSGNERQVNETFMAADGCNTCTCTSSGLVACTLRACVDTCSLPSESGLCQAYFPSYFFNSRTGLCERFVYGGCGGNDNRFSTAAECYRRCNASSQCIQPTYSEEQSDLTCLVVVRKWVFNATFGLCGEIAYSPCGQDSEGYNVFDSERECNRSCIRAEEICPSGEPIVRCFADPCSVNSCPGYPDATCRANYCGGCHAYFFDASGNNVTDQCSARVRPTPVLSTVCPVISNGTGGLCAELCTTDASCTAGLICCPNGCGRSCLEPDHIPYYDIPRQCPDSGDGDLTTGSCVFTNASCLTSDECDDGELCCQSGCGRRCTRSVVPSQPCFAVDDELVFSGRPPAGTYIPSCDADSGVFVPVQCHPSTGYCWCVNTRTGRPNSGLYARGVRPNCTTCNYNGKIYHSGDSFPASDGCNTCFCTDSGVVGCTRRACIDTCSLSPDPGPCRGAFSAYYYDRSQGACLPFVYGGCQGNDNKFQTIGDCLRRCNPESRCIQSTPTICIDTFNSSVETGHYVFNSSSNQCQRFPYGCTSLPIYNDLTQCQRSCNPGSTPDPCALVRCAQPDCPQDRWITNPGECCSRCRPPDSVECEDDEFRCNNTRCISSQWVCDGLRDCADGRDEADRLCAMRNQTCLGHRCGDGGCISSDYVCDDYLDCRDASDEANCTTTAFTNVFYPDQLPTRCPNSTGLIGSCVEECSSDNPCQDEGRMCCANGCGHSCIVGVTVAPLCPALARQQYGAIGAFIPECESDGSFSATQCWGSIGYCWCVDTVTGRPISEGMRGEPGCTGCDVDGTVYPHGERFTAEDGCNTCYCSNTGMAFCTREACAPVSCMVLGGEIPHGQMLEDACSSCMCKSGQLNCTRKVCATVGAITQKPPTRVTMDFSGDLDEIAPTDDHKENFQREIMKTLLNRYKTTLGLSQDQIAKIEVKDEEGVTITVEFTESESVSSGANVTLLVGQMEQDYMSSALVIRYNRAVLEPSGDFQVGDDSASSAFPWWGILIIVVGALVLVALVAVVITGVVVKGKGRRHTGASAELNDYSKVSFKNDEDVDVKVDLDK